MAKKHIVIPSVLLCAAVVPLLAYFSIFSDGFSRNAQDWGAFGSYLSGIYSSIFGLLSVIILVVTLREMRAANKQDKEQFQLQFTSAEADKKLSDVISLTEMLNKLIDINPTITDKKQLPHDFAGQMGRKCREFKVTEQEELYEAAIDLMREQRSRFSAEIHVLAQIVKKINSIQDEEQLETAKAIVKALISDSYRFWFYCYAQVWSQEARFYLKEWHDFDSIPEELERYLPERADDPNDE
ncbi:hypothetical protein [Yersinia bercovieri]|uniref:hypothetical protein n=1 Tax=Yersinia bercovieri TaxID=634 RepID=UPI0005E177A7|nr:hypothetical protein [Yersinia bercovieri]CFQ36823.1 Uncharacterised protein [Yersinia bercovieri]